MENLLKLDLITKKQDEFYTPEYAIKPLLKYINKDYKIWCPFDTEESHFVKMFKHNGNKVYNSHILNGENFFEMNIDCDAIISNPPYSLKGEVFERLFELNKKFAMLVGVVGLFESEKRFSMFSENDFEILYLNRRVAYFQDYTEQKPSLNPPFSSVYICKGLLPKQICFDRIIKSEPRTASQS